MGTIRDHTPGSEPPLVPAREAISSRLRRFDPVVEVGVGRRPDVAAALAAAGTRVTATDVVSRPVPQSVRFVVDDVTDPTPWVYADAELLYACNLPPELHRPALDVARTHDAAFAFTTLGADLPAVPVHTETLPGETLFWARSTPASTSGTDRRRSGPSSLDVSRGR